MTRSFPEAVILESENNSLVAGCLFRTPITIRDPISLLDRTNFLGVRPQAKMRLINVETLGLEEFFGDNVPKYAILSHTWGSEEVSFQWYQSNGPDHAAAKSPMDPLRLGYTKIVHCCAQAQRDGYRYVWVDTCCIDKTSSAELSEAINSMFYWYQQSRGCYVYLERRDILEREDTGGFDYAASFLKSRWFRRGLTVQELIAPGQVEFYGVGWTNIGNRHALRMWLSERTSIPERVLRHPLNRVLNSYSIAQRMSWASYRETTRREDTAYSLL